MTEYFLHDQVVIARNAPKKYQRFARYSGQVIGTAGLTESGVKYRVRIQSRSIVIHGKYLRPVPRFTVEIVHAAPCRFPYERCTCGVM